MKKMAISLGASFIFMILSGSAFAQDEAAAAATDPQEQKAMESEAASGASAASTGTVARGVFTSDVQNHEPVDQLSEVDAGTKTVLFFTELKDFQGETVTHRWEHNGQSMAEVKFQVGGPRWRVWSSKNMMPEWVGTWTVSVVNGNGEVVASETLNYTAAPAAEASTASAADTAVAEGADVEADAASGESAQ